ncbi:prolyl endopeptidase-like isoform X2 [Bufo gargarizans]|uniref:prolyl endopeptidase-like isoform X2 n=1 Tax=Bufo gargarizans TaxID=30331 RepID=UPI001CF15607|nr:prolyl endopeptidase-like isoform X2 [Bufo gargarizans]
MKIRLLVSSASWLFCRHGTRAVEKKLFFTSWQNGCLTGYRREWAKSKLLRGLHSWQALLDCERKRWEAACVTYQDLTEVLMKRLKEMHQKYPIRAERNMIKHGDYTYFDEDSYIYRFQESIGEDSIETLFSPEDAGLHEYVIQRIRISPAQTYLAVTLKSLDREEATCIVVRVEGQPQVVCSIPNVFSCEWVTDNVLFHTRQDNLQCRSVYAAEFSGESTTRLVYHEKDPRFFVDLYMTRDHRFLTINSNSKTSAEVWLVDCSAPYLPPALVQNRLPGVLYHVEHRNGCLYILTTYGEPAEYKLMMAPLNSDVQQWKPIYRVPAESRLLDMEMLEDYCVMFIRQRNELHMDVISLSRETVIGSLKLPAWACALQPESRPEERTSTINFYLESPVHPPMMFAYSVPAKKLSVEAGYSREGSETCHLVRMNAKSKDGTLVPVTVFYKAERGLRDRPLLVHVYGAYGMDLNMSFKAEKRILVEDGWILAYCHVRGGGELGCNWHKLGNLEKKQDGLEDLEACIVHVHGQGFSRPSRTALEAASAGGVLAGALCNSRPWLLQAMVLEAPFLDVLTTMMDPSLPLTIEEHEEWGCPQNNVQHYRAIQAYCPYQNITPQNYPSVLITAYENDQRIALSGLLRYMKKLRTAALCHFQTSALPDWRMPNILLDVQPGGSHCDSLSWEDSLKKVATHLAFLHKELKLQET